MAVRQFDFEREKYYHIFNRGVEKKVIFHDKEDVGYFLDRISDFNNTEPIGGVRVQSFKKNQGRSKASSLVKVVAFCVLPNHFHLILKQSDENGISKFMQRVCTGYAKYYNKKYERSGALFQGKFKAKKLDSDHALQFLSVYVNLNYKHHNINLDKKMILSSLSRYTSKGLKNYKPCDKNEIENILQDMGGRERYKKYAIRNSKYFIERHGISNDDIEFDEF
jgi:REP element-mobilizing transposase RayT